jgi:hypothetical protein
MVTSAVAFGARDNWRYVKTTHFEILSATSEKKTRELVVALEQFRASFISTFGLKPAHEPRVTVVLFNSHSQFKPYYPLYNGKPKQVAGYFVPGADEVAIALTAERDEDEDQDPTQTILHEYVHFLLNARGMRLPTWLNEGIAELFSTFRVNGKVVEYGRPKDLYVDVLNHSSLMPLPKLMAVTESSPDYNEEHRAGMFYAQSWAMAHFLICGADRNNALRLSRYLELIQAPGTDADAAFREVFASDFKELPTKLRAYLHGGQYYQRQAPAPLKDIAAGVMIRGATELERDHALLNLRWRAQQPQDAMLAALYLAEKHPTAPRPRELLAVIAAVDRDAGRALERWTEAAELGSDNPFVLVQAARANLMDFHPGADHEARLTAATATRVRNWLDRACTASPGYDDAWETLALVEARAPEFRIPTIVQVQKHVAQLKDRNPTLLALALVRWRAGDLPTANHLIDTVRESSTAKPHTKAAAEVMRRQFASNFAGESLPPTTVFGAKPRPLLEDTRLRMGER